MAGRADDWQRQAEADLEHARHSLERGEHDWACFAAQQAAEKAAKAAHLSLGEEAWGHSITEFLQAFEESAGDIDSALLDRAKSLDKHYIATRYPNGLPSGAPVDYYTRPEAERAIEDAEAILAFCHRIVSR